MPKTSTAHHRPIPRLDQSKLVPLVGYSLKRAYMRVSGQFGVPVMDRFGVRRTEFAVLALLLDNPDTDQKTLARSLAIDPPNMATLLDTLENRRLVRRVRHPKDGRARQVRLTPTGRRLASRALAAVYRAELAAIALLSPPERVEFVRLLGKLVSAEL